MSMYTFYIQPSPKQRTMRETDRDREGDEREEGGRGRGWERERG